MVVKGVLSDTPESLSNGGRLLLQLSLPEETCQELGIAPAFRKVGEAEVTPPAYADVAVSAVNCFDRDAVGVSEILVKIRGPP